MATRKIWVFDQKPTAIIGRERANHERILVDVAIHVNPKAPRDVFRIPARILLPVGSMVPNPVPLKQT
jgi:hypothetical protein